MLIHHLVRATQKNVIVKLNKHRSRYQETVKLKTLWILFAATLIVAAFEVGYSSYPGTLENDVGVCTHLEDVDNQTIPHLINLGISWVRTDWTAPWDSMREFSQNLQHSGINLLAIIDHKTFGYKVPTCEEWNQRITELVNSGNFSNVDAVEIWNEPNSNAFVSHIEPQLYYEMLKSAYTIIKNYTSIPVVFAGVSPNVPNWKSYLTTVFAHDDIENYFDYMAIHLYDDMEKNQAHLQFVKSLTSKPIWLTETGKPSATEDNTGTEAGQAAYLHSVYDTFEPLVDKMLIYELKDGQGASPLEENYFGLLTLDGAKKNVYSVVWNINRESADIKIGIYYYPWYDANWTINHPNCVDTPYLGKYSSANLSVIMQHLNWFEFRWKARRVKDSVNCQDYGPSSDCYHVSRDRSAYR
jgi:Glycosyl hydrolase catalytic core